jgi:hypothetical protein
MINPNVLLMENILKSSFNVVVTVVEKDGSEKDISFKKRRKDFLRENYTGVLQVVLVDYYPPEEMKFNVYYIKKSGKIVWIKMKKEDATNI